MSLWPLTPVQQIKRFYHGYDFLNPVLFVPGRGLLCVADSFEPGYITLDGVFQELTGNPGITLGWWHERQRIVKWSLYGLAEIYGNANLDGIKPGYTNGTGAEIQYDPRSFIEQWTGPAEDLPALDESWPYYSLMNSSYVKFRDKRFYFSDSRIHALDRNGVMTIEGPSFPFGLGNIQPGRSHGEVFVSAQHDILHPAQCIFYNTESKQFSSPLYQIRYATAPYQHVGHLIFCSDFGVIALFLTKTDVVSAEGNSKDNIQIYSLEVRPTVMVGVSVVGGVLKPGHLVTYRVQILGDLSDPCEGELVDWKVEGTGTLLNLQSTTDVNGYATARVQYGVTESGPSTVSARVIC